MAVKAGITFHVEVLSALSLKLTAADIVGEVIERQY